MGPLYWPPPPPLMLVYNYRITLIMEPRHTCRNGILLYLVKSLEEGTF